MVINAIYRRDWMDPDRAYKIDSINELIELITTELVPNARAMVNPRSTALYPHMRELLRVTGKAIKACKYISEKILLLSDHDLDRSIIVLGQAIEKCKGETQELKNWTESNLRRN